ncbi:MAG TPA: hypothetical protein ENJ82_04435 [Bacteroidetes bacterium]|nr:hypothetical protein [Bacteroidota bacterium]
MDTNQKLEKLIAKRGKLLPQLLDEFEEKVNIKKETKILILAEKEADHQQLVSYLKAKGFPLAEGMVPKHEKSFAADLIIFHRSSTIIDYNQIDDQFIQTYIRANWKKQALLYFGPYNSSLDTRTEQIVFANYRQKLAGNILELMGDLRDLKRIQE